MAYLKLILFAATLYLSSCATLRSSSKFPHGSISLGMSRGEIVRILGKPFTEDVLKKDKKIINTLSYKGTARVRNQGFIITTLLTLENDSLVSIKQNEKCISELGITLDSTYRCLP